jgi:PAS domain S-box-containing protein
VRPPLDMNSGGIRQFWMKTIHPEIRFGNRRSKEGTPDAMKGQELIADQVRKLYEHTVFGSVATLINGTVLVFVLRHRVSSLKLSLWLCAAILISLLRLSLYRSYHKNTLSQRETARWKNFFIASLFFAGLLWGAAAIFLYPPDAIGHQAFIALVIGGMVAGAVGSFTSVLTAFYLFSIPALAPITVRFFLQGTEIHFAMGCMALLFLLIMSMMASRTHKEYINLLSLKFENSGLVGALRQEVVQRKLAEKDLRIKNAQIEEIVAERTLELETAVNRLRHEVKARKMATHALKENQQRMRAIINYAPLLIWAVDRDGVFTFSEGKGLDMIGFKPGEVVGQSIFELFRDNTQIIQNTKQALNGELVSGPTAFGGVVYENRLEPIVDDEGRISGVIGVAIDVTNQQKALEALRRSEEKYRELVENINDVLFTIDRKGRIIYISPVVESVFGYRSREMLAKRFYDFVDADDRLRVESEFEKVFRENAVVSEYRLIGKSGQTKWCRSSARPIMTNGRPIGVQGILADITQSKQLEEQLRRAHKMEALGTLAGGVAHDLNNILCGIVSYPDLLLLDLPQESPLREPLTTIKASGEKATAIVQDLLTLGRRGVAATELLNLNPIIEEYLTSPEFKSLQALYPNIRIRRDLQSDLFNLEGSRVHLSKTLMNLVANAAEAMPMGGAITIQTANRYADEPVAGFDTVAEGEYVVLTVTDAGIGIDEEDLARIFEPFYTKKVMGRSGSGLGMAVVWGTVKDHGGYINASSRKDAGSCFELLFPATRRQLPSNASTVPHEAYMGAGESILIVDDVKQQREIAARMLTRLGYRPETVASGEAAIEYLSRESADLILLDMIMTPGIDGLETYRRILQINGHQKAIIVSGYSESEQVRATQALGAGSYIKKPYTLEALGTTIKAELQA